MTTRGSGAFGRSQFPRLPLVGLGVRPLAQGAVGPAPLEVGRRESGIAADDLGGEVRPSATLTATVDSSRSTVKSYKLDRGTLRVNDDARIRRFRPGPAPAPSARRPRRSPARPGRGRPGSARGRPARIRDSGG